jgi:predicted nucleic acid-binding protein
MPAIVVDANVFLRFIVRAETPQDVQNASIAASLFGQWEQGLLEITTNAAVIAEVAFSLSSQRHYALRRSEAVSRLLPLLRLQNCILPEKDLVVRALERWERSQKLSFVDSLVIEQSLNERAMLASFDRQVRGAPEVTLWSDQESLLFPE